MIRAWKFKGGGSAHAASHLDGGSDPVFGLVPIGGIIAWAKSFNSNTPALPSNFVECSGGTISDAASPYNTIAAPDLNSTGRFLRGSSSSGATGGSACHQHTVSTSSTSVQSGIPSVVINSVGANTGLTDGRPPFYDIVWVMRIK